MHRLLVVGPLYYSIPATPITDHRLLYSFLAVVFSAPQALECGTPVPLWLEKESCAGAQQSKEPLARGFFVRSALEKPCKNGVFPTRTRTLTLTPESLRFSLSSLMTPLTLMTLMTPDT